MVIRAKILGLGPKIDASKSTRIRITNPWHAVSIDCDRQGCGPARKLGGQRFLSGHAPTLPLASCMSPLGCRCVYKHHDDRRSDPRRIIDHGASLRASAPFIGEERRNRRGRRATDG